MCILLHLSFFSCPKCVCNYCAYAYASCFFYKRSQPRNYFPKQHLCLFQAFVSVLLYVVHNMQSYLITSKLTIRLLKYSSKRVYDIISSDASFSFSEDLYSKMCPFKNPRFFFSLFVSLRVEQEREGLMGCLAHQVLR